MARTAWGIKPKNEGQEQALKALLDPSIELVILSGIAGSGKTLLTVAAGLEQVLENRLYKEIVFTRAPVPVGDDMGFLPGEINDKMLPWCGALLDNLETLRLDEGTIERKVKLMALMHMRGRSLNNRYVIIDETQNLTAQQLKVVITRAGENTKLVCLGDMEQIDTRKLTKENNGLSYLINKAKGCDFIKAIDLPQGERSRLATWGATEL